MGNNLLRLRVFPVPPKGDQKVALSYKSVAPKDGSVVEYVYPLKTDGKATRTLEEFSVKLNDQVAARVQNVYSPTHAITTDPQGRQGSGDRRSSGTRRCSTRTSSSSTASATRTSA